MCLEAGSVDVISYSMLVLHTRFRTSRVSPQLGQRQRSLLVLPRALHRRPRRLPARAPAPSSPPSWARAATPSTARRITPPTSRAYAGRSGAPRRRASARTLDGDDVELMGALAGARVGISNYRKTKSCLAAQESWHGKEGRGAPALFRRWDRHGSVSAPRYVSPRWCHSSGSELVVSVQTGSRYGTCLLLTTVTRYPRMHR